MRWIIGILAIVIVLAWVGYQMDISEAIKTDSHVVQTVWRHTANGWEKVSALSGLKFRPSAITDFWETHPHPLVIASLVAMLSLMALVAFNPARRPGVEKHLVPRRLIKASDKQVPVFVYAEQELRSRAWLEQANLQAAEAKSSKR